MKRIRRRIANDKSYRNGELYFPQYHTAYF
jgi:hypothetical protein